MILKGGLLLNALVQLQARYYHCGEAASEKCLPAATFVRPLRGWESQSGVSGRLIFHPETLLDALQYCETL